MEAIGRLSSEIELMRDLAVRDREEIRHDIKNILTAMRPLQDIPERVKDLEAHTKVFITIPLRVQALEATAAFVERVKQNSFGALAALVMFGALAVEGVHKTADIMVGWFTK